MQLPKFKVNQVVRCGLSQEKGRIESIRRMPTGFWYVVCLFNYGTQWVPEFDITLCDKVAERSKAEVCKTS